MGKLADRICGAQFEDINFLLWRYLRCDEDIIRRFGLEKDSAVAILAEASRFACLELAPLSSLSDSEGCHLRSDGSVAVPRHYESVWKKYCSSGFLRLGAPLDCGGIAGPYVLSIALNEILIAADPAFFIYSGFNVPALRLIEEFGSSSERRWSPALASGNTSACLCLTEPAAGSDLANITTSATKTEDGWYKLKGTKCFISAGMHDLAQNILYVVLARTSGAAPDSRGLSCFLVPRFRNSGSGQQISNDVHCRRVERTMGLRGCPTVELEFGATDDCYGELLGEYEGRGLPQLRRMMAEARIATGIFSVAIADAAYRSAVGFAASRRQGARLGRVIARAHETVPIICHADVKRMIMEMKCRLEGCRVLLYRLAWHKTAAMTEGTVGLNVDLDQRAHLDMVDLLTPVLKAYSADQAWRVSELAIQVHGGSGYVEGSIPERCVRDAKVLSIWEGTNYIQSMDLVVEKLALGRESRPLLVLLREMDAGFASLPAEKYVRECEALREALEVFRSCHRAIGEWVKRSDFDQVGLTATRMLRMLAEVVVAWLLLEVATSDARRDYTFHEDDLENNRVAIAKYYCRNVLPMSVARGKIILDDRKVDWPTDWA